MDFQKRSYRTIFITATVILGAAIAFIFFWIYNSKPVSQPAVPSATQQGPSSAFYLATRNDNPTANDRSDTSDREMEYKLSTVEVQSSFAEFPLGTIHPSIFSSAFGYRDGGIYFVNAEGELAAYSIGSGFTNVVKIPDIKPVFGFFDEHSMYDFILSGDTITYLQGGCTDSQSCDLRQYNFATKTMSPIMSHLEKSMNISGETTIKLHDRDPKTVTLLKTRNTAKGGYADLVQVLLDTKKQTVTKTVEFGLHETSTPSDTIFTKTLSCEGITATEKIVDVPNSGDADMQTTITLADGTSKFWMPTYIVGCVTPPYLQ